MYNPLSVAARVVFGRPPLRQRKEAMLRKFERMIVLTLLGMMMLAVLVSTIELAVVLVQELLKPPRLLLNISEMLEFFGFFLMVLIGLELLETIKAYLDEDRVHAEVVLLVALVAVARKVIIFDHKDMSPQLLFGMSALILSLSAGYVLVKYALQRLRPKESAKAN
jgi:uncharacterized membrane protein (DUF373 family)